MAKKYFAGLLLAIAAIFIAPAAANASTYVPDENSTVTGTIAPGATATVGFSAGSFDAGESVTFTLTGEEAQQASLATFKLAVNTKTHVEDAQDDGSHSVNVTLHATATGSYTLTATGADSGRVATETLTVAAAGNGSNNGSNNGGTLPDTGSDVSMLALWAGGGALLLGAGLIATITVVRRQRHAQD